MSKRVLTVYSCGTCFSSQKSAEEIVAFSHFVTLGDDDSKWINQGPGNPDIGIKKVAKILEVAEAKPSKPPSGFFGKRSYAKAAKAYLDEHASGKVPKLFAEKHKESDSIFSGGVMYGTGWADNVAMTLQWLWLNHYNPGFDTVNLVGWSRGGVTSIMIAHAMEEAGFAKVRPGLEVNIFAFDPVPGGKSDFKTNGGKAFETTGKVGDPNSLPAIVTSYESILMEHESKPFFNCVSPKPRNKNTTLLEIPLAGSHSAAVKYKANPAGYVGAHLVHDFLKRKGTRLAPDMDLTLNDLLLCEKYSLLALDYKDKPPSSQRKWIPNPSRNEPYFVNAHHETVFSMACPQLYLAFNAPRGKKVSALEVDKLEHRMPSTWKALHELWADRIDLSTRKGKKS